MTLDEAIKHAEEVAIDQDLCCSECAEEHRQLAEWLKDYKQLLEQQPSEDCVSRQSMLDAITEIDENINMDIYTNEVREIIEALPPVTPTQSWIPVSKKLPEESGNYLIYGKVVDYEENCVFIGEYDSDYEKFGYEENIYDSETLGFVDSEFCEYNKVIAWQPLPQPYEEKRGSEDESK